MALSNLSSLCLFSFSTTLDTSARTNTIRNHKSLPGSILTNNNISPRRRRRRLGEYCRAAIVEDTDKEAVIPPETGEEEEEKKQEVAEYDWREEWYPLYLTAEVPDDAPLGLTVFHKQIVLYRDGQGILHCYEDRCPHRFAHIHIVIDQQH